MSQNRTSGVVDGPPALDELLESLRQLLAAAASRRGRDTRRPGELSLAQIRLIRRLQEGGAMTGARLAEAAGLSAGAVSEMLEGLERKGIVCRAASDADRRWRLFSLSSEGARLVEERLRAFRTEVEEALGDCSESDLVAAARVIDRLGEMLGRR